MILKRFSVVLFLVILSVNLLAQYTSIHHQQSEYYKQYQNYSEQDFDQLNNINNSLNAKKPAACNLTHQVYGWHPYWVGTAYNNYDFNLLSTFSYFSYELNPATGNYNSIHSWKTSNSITMAQAAGARVELCVTNFGSTNNNTFLTNSTARQTLIDSLISLLAYRNADGVNIDFEGVSGSNRNDLTSFMIQLSTQLKAARPGSTVSMATFSVDWNNVFDFAVLSNYVDQFIIMGYGYYYSGSSVAGPTDPLYSGTLWSSYNLIRSIDYHLKEGVPKNKLLIGLPYYGYEWETVSNTVTSNTTGNFSSSRTYSYVKNNTSGNYSNRQYDYQSETPYYIYNTGSNWRQAFVCDEQSLAKRYDVVKQLEIAGIGIWALGYDAGYTQLWDLLEEKFTDCSVIACTDTIYDRGGAYGQYRNDENYTLTISPTGASSLSLTFLEFDVEVGFDSLWIYDGASTAAPLIGGYSGTSLPPVINSSGSSLTLEFYSDGATRGDGWKAVYSCFKDTIKPTTQISSSPTPSATGDFTSNFTDADNIGGSGVMHTFYQVADFNTSEWRANNDNAFFNDNFETTIHPDWIDSSGVWSIANNKLQQTDQNNTNTNLYAALDQNNNIKFLYHYKATISGTGNNKRAGFHYMCDDASQTNRGNSYFVWFRQDDGKLQFYKVTNNGFTLEKDVVYNFNAGQEYDYKIVYDKTTGITEVYVDDKFIDSWKDNTPLTVGNAVSFRSGDCVYEVDELRVYKNRTASALITVGSSPTNDIRYENNPTASGKIRSLVIDSAYNVSTITTEMVDVDFATSIEELNSGLFKVYPNPTKAVVNIEIDENALIIIRDITGKVIDNKQINTDTVIDVSDYDSGVYLLQIKTEKYNEVVRLVKQ